MHPNPATSDDLRKRNRATVISAVRRNGKISRTDLSHATGLSAATVTAITAGLIEQGVLNVPEKSPTGRLGKGRPAVQLAVNPRFATVCSVVLKYGEVSAQLVDFTGQKLQEIAIPLNTITTSSRAIRSAMVRCVKTLLSRTKGVTQIAKIVVGVQGSTDVSATTLLWSPVITKWQLPISKWLSDEFDTTTTVFNDAAMIAYSLYVEQQDVYGQNFVAIMLSSGVGMGLFRNGQLLGGTASSGMEFGHMTYQAGGALCGCGRRGCIEAYAGYAAILRSANKQSPNSPLPDIVDTEDVRKTMNDALAGKRAAKNAIKQAGSALGAGLCSLFALFDAFPVAMVGPGTQAFDIMEDPIRAALRESIAGLNDQDVVINCYPDEMPLLHRGCAFRALHDLDIATANDTAPLSKSVRVSMKVGEKS